MATLADEASGATIQKQGFMKKVTFFDPLGRTEDVDEKETVFVSDKGLDIQEDREEILRRAQEQRS